jgi:DNA-binding Xre family transcriptional regulator
MAREVLNFSTDHFPWHPMSQAFVLVDALKGALRQRGLTYVEVGRGLGLSESSVKRMLAQKKLSLNRFEQICGLMGLEIADLVELAHQAENRIVELTEEQERELVSDPKVLLVAVLVFNYWSAAKILETYRLTEAELVKVLTRLDKMRIIDLLPGNRIKVRLARNFKWRKAGPIQRNFEERLQREFFDSHFLGTDELRVFASGRLSRRSIAQLQAHLRKIAEEFDSLVSEDRHLDHETQTGTSLVMAIRPWEPNQFAALRRDHFKTSPARRR